MGGKGERKGGGKLSRSETVTVRLDPITRFAAEIAANKEKRTLSSFIEMAVRDAANNHSVIQDRDGGMMSALEVAERAWAPDRAARLFNLAMNAPQLLDPEHKLLGKAICEFMTEVTTVMSRSRISSDDIAFPGGGQLFLPGHLALSAFDEIESAISDDRIDRDRLVEIAKSELKKRLITRKGGKD